MSLIKIIQPNAWDFSEPVAQLIKIGSRGRLVGFDRQIFIKRAGEMITNMLDGLKFAADEQPIHLLAVGATPMYGANRNGDGFDAITASTRHHTFVKRARFYRNHQNTDPAKSFGVVKASAFHEPMQRIELICGLNMNKAAAERNGGLVADREMEKLAREEEIPVSMACMVPFDECSYCHNHARTRADYCDSIENGGHCKAGGLKHNIGNLVNVDGDVHQLHANNPNCTFFDISHVYRPADRIAYVTGQLKAAGEAHAPTGLDLAEAYGLSVPFELLVSDERCLPDMLRHQLKLAHQLAHMPELHVLPECERLGFTAGDRHGVTAPPAGLEKLGQVLRALADEQINLPVTSFLMLVGGQSEKQAAELAPRIIAALPNAFVDLTEAKDLEAQLLGNPYLPAKTASSDLRYWAHQQAERLSIADQRVVHRIKVAVLRCLPQPRPSQFIKTGSTKAACSLARDYALYQLGFLTTVQQQTSADLALTANRCVAQNYLN